MHELLTYDLRAGSGTTTRAFYRELPAFADRVLEQVTAEAGPFLSSYAAFCVARGEERRGRGEYAVELLTLGVAWLRYGGAARACPRAATRAGIFLFAMRRRWPLLKPVIDPVRGRLASRWLLPARATGPGRGLRLDQRSFDRLLHWLEATGEFKDEVKRLRNWGALAREHGAPFCAELFAAAVACARWFADEARRDLGRYTTGVETFLRERHPAYADREDRIFCGKAEVEYHLAMLSSELTNRGLREDFQATARKVVLLPACMRRCDEGTSCRARPLDGELRCAACSVRCAIGRVTRLGRKAGFETRIIPHSSGFTRSLLRYQGSTDEGVVAVACALNIVPGGYEMRELRIPSQCVLLDYSGCSRHWHPTGIPTDLSDERLLELLLPGEKPDRAQAPPAAQGRPEKAGGGSLYTT